MEFSNARQQAKIHIRRVLEDLGAATVKELREEVKLRGVLTDDILSACTDKGLTDLCREALKKKGADGLPFAKPIEAGSNPTWKMLVLFTRDQLDDLLIREYRALENDCEELRRLRDSRIDRFGVEGLPEMPLLSLMEPA